MRDIPITRVMTTDPITVGADESAITARDILNRGDIHHLPVVADGKLVGIVSASDLLKFYLLDKTSASLDKVTVRSIMVRDPVVLQASDALHDAAGTLSLGGFHACPVVDANHVLVGIVTSSDLIQHLSRQIERGDGSMRVRAQPHFESAADPSDGDITAVMRTARESSQGNGVEARLAKMLLHFRDRNRQLQEACNAAQHYLRSGHGEREHSVLIRRLSDL